MSSGLLLTMEEFDRMVQCGAFEHLNRKVEFFRGELRQMSPAGSLHDGLVTFLINWSHRSTDPNQTMVTSQTGLNVSNLQSRPEPDIMWIRPGRYLDQHPSASDVKLAFEVADSSLNYDINEKAELYAEAGIAEYWVVDATASCVHVFRDPQGKAYRQRAIANRGEQLSPLADPNAVLDVTELFGGEG